MSELGDSESADLPLAKILAIANRRKLGVYLAVDCVLSDDGVVNDAELRGGSKPTLHRTMRNAGRFDNRHDREAASLEQAEQVVILLDLELLPVVLPELVDIQGKPGYSDAAFAERQAELWANRAETVYEQDDEDAFNKRQSEIWTKRAERLLKER